MGKNVNLASDQRVDFRNLRLGQRPKLHRFGVFLDLFDRPEAGDGDVVLAARPEPGQRSLGQCAPVARQDFADGSDLFKEFRVGQIGRAHV